MNMSVMECSISMGIVGNVLHEKGEIVMQENTGEFTDGGQQEIVSRNALRKAI